MKPRRFFTERFNLRVGSSVKLLDDQAEHIRDSLRLKRGDKITLFNGQKEFLAELRLIKKDVIMAEIIGEGVDVEGGFKSNLFFGLIKQNHLEIMLQKCTELGVNAFIPMFTEYSQILPPLGENKLARWQKLIVEACKQSGQQMIPELTTSTTFASAVKIALENKGLNLFFTSQGQQFAFPAKHVSEVETQIHSAAIVNIFIGTEGGFSPQEHKLAEQAKFEFVHLGENILRAETAGIIAVNLVNYVSAKALSAE